MATKWGLLTNAPDGCEWGTLWRDADRRIPWHTPRPEDRGPPASHYKPMTRWIEPCHFPVLIDPPKPRRNNGPIAWRKIPTWLLAQLFRWK